MDISVHELLYALKTEERDQEQLLSVLPLTAHDKRKRADDRRATLRLAIWVIEEALSGIS